MSGSADVQGPLAGSCPQSVATKGDGWLSPEKTKKREKREKSVKTVKTENPNSLAKASMQYVPLPVVRVDLESRREHLEVNLTQVACIQEIQGANETWLLYSTAVKAPERVSFEDDGSGEVDPLVGEPVGPKVLHAIKVLGSFDSLRDSLKQALPVAADWREVTRAQGMIISPVGLVLQAKRVAHERLLVNFHFVAHTNANFNGCQVVFLNIHLPPRLDILEAQLTKADEALKVQKYQTEQLQQQMRQMEAREAARRFAEAEWRRQQLERQRVLTRRRVSSFVGPRGDCLPYIVLLPSVDVLTAVQRSQSQRRPLEPEPEMEPCSFGAGCRTYPDCPKFHEQSPALRQSKQPNKEAGKKQPVLCSFGDNCTRYPDCSFYHEAPPLGQTVKKQEDKSKVPCMFAESCQKWPNCEFVHATVPKSKICGFGDACTRYPDCGYHHANPPRLRTGGVSWPQGQSVAGGRPRPVRNKRYS